MYQRALQRIRAGRDPAFYQTAVNLYNNYVQSDKEKEEVDAAWLEKVNAQNTSERNKLEVELKTYTSNMIRESIRVSLHCSVS